MGGKKDGSNLATNIKLGTRVRHVEDGVQGRIVWANATSVKIQWDDGEKVTWKRAELGVKGVAVVEKDGGLEVPATGAAPTTEPETTPTSDTATEPKEEANAVAAPAEAPAEQLPAEATAPVQSEPAAPVQAEAAPAKKQRKRSANPETSREKKPSALDAATRVLAEEHRPMGCQELIGTMAAKGYWTSPGGKTPAATLYSALLREIDTKGDASRFVRVGKGQFALRPQA